MLKSTRNRSLIAFFIIALVTLLATSPILSHGDSAASSHPVSQEQDGGNGNGGGHGNGNANGNANGNGNGNGGGQEPPPPSPERTSDGLLGCQRNHPDRLDCSSLDVNGHCDGTTAVFTIRNGGEPGNGDMRAPTEYRLYVDGVLVETGQVLLPGGQSMEIRFEGGGNVTLEADQQVGHPGNSHPRITLNCGGQTPEPTIEPPTPTATSTQLTPYHLFLEAYCLEDGGAGFHVTNDGGDMTTTVYFVVTDEGGNMVEDGQFQLIAGEVMTLEYPGSGILTLTIEGQSVANVGCAPGSQTPTPTEPPLPPDLLTSVDCNQSGFPTFIITNVGGDMTEPMPYVVLDSSGNVIDEGTLQLAADETITLAYNVSGTLLLDIGGGLFTAVADCQAIPTDEPTIEPTIEPSVEPTIEPTITPTATLPPPGCQRNNPDRLDCSSLQVSGHCEGGVAVFTIRNGGESGNGDMRAPTEYRLYVDGVLVETGQVLLLGGQSTEIRFEGGGTVRLEADQQVGHPGKSHPRTTLHCAP